MIDARDLAARDEFIAVMAAEGVPEITSAMALKVTRELHKLAEDDCNYGLTPKQVARNDQLEATIVELLRPHVKEIEIQGDPRGAVVKLRLKSGKANDWGGEGLFCVPAH